MGLLLKELRRFREQLGIKDPGHLENILGKKLEIILGTPLLKNLKHRLQLGLLPYAKEEWKEAKHSRFEHTIGVMAKSLIACDIINRNTNYMRKILKESKLYPNEKITPTDAFELCVAAALHDSFHLPISHATERAILSVKGEAKGVRHEERVMPLLFLYEEKYFGHVRDIICNDFGLPPESVTRVCLLIGGKTAKIEAQKYENFVWPKRAIFQMLNSALDMDRLDFILRDAERTKYLPVVNMSKSICNFLNGLVLVNTSMPGKRVPRNPDVELCLLNSFLTEAFNMLVSRVLLYNYVYFNSDVRALEGTHTYLIAELLRAKTYFPFLTMMTWKDDDLIDFTIKEIKNIEDEHAKDLRTIAESLKGHRKYYEKIAEIEGDKIRNPRLRQEFIGNLNEVEYIRNLQNTIFEYALSKTKENDLQRCELLLDPFILKTGGGDYLVLDLKNKNLKTLDDYMNGSNMHRLCSQNRVDVYLSKTISDSNRNAVKTAIDWFIEM